MVQASKLSKIKIVQCDENGNVARSGTSVTFQFNPEELKFSLVNQSVDKSESGGGVVPGPPSSQAFVAKHREGITTRFDTRLEASHGSLNDKEHAREASGSLSSKNFVEKKISALQKLATPRKKNDAFSLPLVIAIWGKIRYSPVSVITTLDIQYKLFDTDGIPIRAEVGIELTEFDPTTTAENDRALPLQNPTSFTPKPEKMHLVQAGERLEQVAEEVYGSANEWRAIASANGITDPFQDFRGRPLIIPNKKELDNG